VITTRAPMPSIDPQTDPVRVRYREEYPRLPALVGRGAEFPGRKLPLEFNKITYLIAIA
jgi:hypothetical protein